MGSLRYRPFPGGRFYPAGFILFMAVAGVAGFAGAASSGELFAEVGVFLAFFAVVLACNAYCFLVKFSAELVLEGHTLRAKTVFDERRIPLNDLKVVRPMRIGFGGAVFELHDGTKVSTVGNKGFIGFVNALSARRPDLPVRVGSLAQLADAMPGSDGLKQLT